MNKTDGCITFVAETASGTVFALAGYTPENTNTALIFAFPDHKFLNIFSDTYEKNITHKNSFFKGVKK